MFGRARKWIVYGIPWVLSAAYFAFWDTVLYSQPFHRMLPMNLLQHMVWALEGLLILDLAKRCPIDTFSPRAWKAWLVNLGAGTGYAVLGLAIAWVIALGFKSQAELPHGTTAALKSLRHFFAVYYHSVLLIMWVVLGTSQVYLLNRRVRTGELEAAQMAHSLVQARHQALRAQLQPHFLFNTLHSISTLIHLDPDAADKMVIRLADLLRMSLDTTTEQLIPLRREIVCVELYLGIEKVRFQERLEIRTEIPAELGEIPVPSFLLQPLVENAIKHGLSKLGRGGRILIRARRDGDWLVLEVEDTGVGYQPTGSEGVGLSNTRSRLALLYGESQSLEISGIPDTGTRVAVRVPISGRAV